MFWVIIDAVFGIFALTNFLKSNSKFSLLLTFVWSYFLFNDLVKLLG